MRSQRNRLCDLLGVPRPQLVPKVSAQGHPGPAPLWHSEVPALTQLTSDAPARVQGNTPLVPRLLLLSVPIATSLDTRAPGDCRHTGPPGAAAVCPRSRLIHAVRIVAAGPCPAPCPGWSAGHPSPTLTRRTVGLSPGVLQQPRWWPQQHALIVGDQADPLPRPYIPVRGPTGCPPGIGEAGFEPRSCRG